MNYFNYLQLVIQIGTLSKYTYNDFKYECVKETSCRKSQELINKSENEWRPNGSMHLSFDSCRLVCGPNARLWPIPQQSFTLSKSYSAIDPSLFAFFLNDYWGADTADFILNIIQIFKENVKAKCPETCRSFNRTVTVNLEIEDPELQLNWNTNEKYELIITTVNDSDSLVSIKAQTVFGIRHGLETLTQLIAPGVIINDTTQLVMLNSARIKDWPAFRHRGIHINTGRTYYVVNDLLSIIDGMAACKMNVLHWQASNKHSFSLKIDNVPQMSMYGAFTPKNVYTTKEMEMIVRYAKYRGVRVILEIEVPSTSTGWEWGNTDGLGNLTICHEQKIYKQKCVDFPPCGALNPVNVNTFKVLKKIYTDLLRIFGRDGITHLGGQEVFFDCWNSTSEVLAEMKRKKLGRTWKDFIQIWSLFHNKQLEILNEETGEYAFSESAIIWSSSLTLQKEVKDLLNNCKFIIQTDANHKLDTYLNNGYKLILYLNSTLLDKCQVFKPTSKMSWWNDVYGFKLPQKQGILGYEITEFIDMSKFSTKVIAVSEKLWSNPEDVNASKRALQRLPNQARRLQQRNVMTDFDEPEWCEQFEAICWNTALV